MPVGDCLGGPARDVLSVEIMRPGDVPSASLAGLMREERSEESEMIAARSPVQADAVPGPPKKPIHI